MINLWVGNIGHFLVISAFILAIANAVSYAYASYYQQESPALSLAWRRYARASFALHGLAVIGIIAALFHIIYHHLYEYHYAWSHSSNNLPTQYMISCFWEGQEGSFLLWIFWYVVIGSLIIFTNRKWEAPVMLVVSSVQAFLLSMILGIVVFNLKIGSDPFILLRDAMPHLPVFQAGSPAFDPNFVPEDGTGLNALLQNYWMVIHPPTLFLGFALTLIPFAFCIAGLWRKDYEEWVRPALPWAIVGAGILGLGILMGAYWAYETLNFGGYWNWDPVENAVYVPWLVMVASIHTMIAYKNNQTALKAAMILVISTFVLILYSTFLTRSGVLGNASVHSFTDLGLSGQLLLYLLFFTILSIALLIYRWPQIPGSKKEISSYSREFWIFMGATVLCLAGFQVLLTTSIPVYNTIIENFGYVSNLALPADQIEHFTKFQLWAGVFIALLSGTGQFFWWKKIDREKLFQALSIPLILTLLISAALIAYSEMRDWKFMILLTASIYSIVSNLKILGQFLKPKAFRLAGGSIAHIGIALMLLGILTSAGYSRVVSKNNSGLLLFDPDQNPDVPSNENEENVLLWLNKPNQILDYKVTYRGDYLEAKSFPHYVKKSSIRPTDDPFKVIANEPIQYQNRNYFEVGDTLQIYPENTYYEVEYEKENGEKFSLFPRAQINPEMGGLLASPDIAQGFTRDIYTHVSSVPDPSEPRKWKDEGEFKASVGDTLFMNDYVAIFEKHEAISSQEVMKMVSNQSEGAGANDIGIRAIIKILGEGSTYTSEPVFFIQNNQVGLLPSIVPELGLKLSLNRIDTDTGEFSFGLNTTQKDYIIMKAVEKPFINLLWIGTLVLMLGFSVATYRRYADFKTRRNQGQE